MESARSEGREGVEAAAEAVKGKKKPKKKRGQPELSSEQVADGAGETTKRRQRRRGKTRIDPVFILWPSSSVTNNPPSEENNAPTTSPARSSRLEYELTRCYPITFPGLPPIDISALYTSTDYVVLDVFGTPQIQWRPNNGHPSRQPDLQPNVASSSSRSHADVHQKSQTGKGVLKPPKLCDKRLDQLDIKHWTSVDISNEFASVLFSRYLETDHPLMALFDADLFVDDLVKQKGDFCSSLLVNAVLFWACHAQAFWRQEVVDLGKQFGKEVETLFGRFDSSPLLLRLPACVLMSTAYTADRRDDLGRQFRAHAVRLMRELDLLGPPEDIGKRLSESSIRHMKARSHTAWGTFNWLVLMSLNYPEWNVRQTPRYPIPGEDSVFAIDTAGEHVQYELPGYMDSTFPMLCKFCLVANEITLLYFSESSELPILDRVELSAAENIYQRLLQWEDDAAFWPGRQAQESHHMATFRIYYHCAILDLFRPFLGHDMHFQTLPPPYSPDAAFDVSLNHLKRYVLLFAVLYPSASYSVWWHPALIRVANAMLSDTSSLHQRFYFLLCAYHYYRLSFSFSMGSTLLRGLVTMAAERKLLAAEEADEILQEFQSGEGGFKSDTSGLLLDYDMALMNLEAATTDALANKLSKVELSKEELGSESDSTTPRPTAKEP